MNHDETVVYNVAQYVPVCWTMWAKIVGFTVSLRVSDLMLLNHKTIQ